MDITDKEYDKEVEQSTDGTKYTLTLLLVSKNKEEIEKVAYSIYDAAKKKGMIVKGVSSYKNNKLVITTRRSPCGNGSNTYDKYTMVIRKKSLVLSGTYEDLKMTTELATSPDVFIQVKTN
ncbi:small subunit ribosomal protein S20e [Nematocida sp. AWRm77]|nr:small subunit ribosomal protein S20e [Nematocida sp. AWRm77]